MKKVNFLFPLKKSTTSEKEKEHTPHAAHQVDTASATDMSQVQARPKCQQIARSTGYAVFRQKVCRLDACVTWFAVGRFVFSNVVCWNVSTDVLPFSKRPLSLQEFRPDVYFRQQLP